MRVAERKERILESWEWERSSYIEEAEKLWGWRLPVEEQIPHLKGIKSFAKLLQGPGKRIIVRFKDEDRAPAYYNQKYRVVAICYGDKWREPLEKFEWWAEAMVAHEIGHVRFTPDLANFPVWNLIEDRRIEESMVLLFPNLRARFEKVVCWVLDNLYGSSIRAGTTLAYPACVAFHYLGAEPTLESLEQVLKKRIHVKKVNGHPVGEFLNDLYLLVREALCFAGETKVSFLYRVCKLFQAKYFPGDGSGYSISPFEELVGENERLSAEKVEEVGRIPGSAVSGGRELRPLADVEMEEKEAFSEREKTDRAEKFCLGKYNSVEDIEWAIDEGFVSVHNSKVPSISRGVVKRFLSFFPSADRSKQYAEEGVRLDMRRYLRGYDDFFVAPKRAPAPYCIDVVVDGSGSMMCIEDLYKDDGEHAYVRKVLRLLQEVEKVSNLRFRVMLTLGYFEKPLFIKGDYDGKWLPLAFSFRPDGEVENFRSTIPYLKSKTVLVITDGCFVEREDVKAIKELAMKKTLIGLYIQGEHGSPYSEVEPYMSNFHRFLYIRDENDLWKLGKVLARFVR